MVHFRSCALEHVELSLFVSTTTRAFRDFTKVSFLLSSVEPTVEIFCYAYIFRVGEFVVSLVKASPVGVVVIIFILAFVLVKEEQ